MENKIIAIIVVLIFVSLLIPTAFAHQSGCHRWHSCPSDSGSYTCGDTGYCSGCPNNQYCEGGQPRRTSQESQPSYEETPPISSSESIAFDTIKLSKELIVLKKYSTDSLKIFGGVYESSYKYGQPVILTITRPDLYSEDISLRVTSVGSFEYPLIFEHDSPKGTWKIESKYVGIEGPTLKFDVIENEESEPKMPQKIPEWVRNVFVWYANGQIGEDDLISAIQFLIKEGIIKV